VKPKSEISMSPNISKIRLQSHKPVHPTMPHPKSGMNNPTTTKAIFGHSDACYMKWLPFGPPSAPTPPKNSTLAFKLDYTIPFHHAIHNSFVLLSNLFSTKTKNLDPHAKNCSINQKCYKWKNIIRKDQIGCSNNY
jgi:hypothetical protein